ncbi:hypothetical protein AURDEDRAFT_159317 [Auricularia subglabra TFB-10046 SS5]|nr:hypothetical protein AURDEDRAFT_159317 [Auricularia subglabra TFB-10046 SS5]
MSDSEADLADILAPEASSMQSLSSCETPDKGHSKAELGPFLSDLKTRLRIPDALELYIGRAIRSFPTCLPLYSSTRRTGAGRHVPEDILYLIFGHVLDCEIARGNWAQPFTANLVLSSVSRSWRLAALATPGLWQFVFIDAARLAGVGELVEHLVRVRTFVRLSKGTVHRLCIVNFPGTSFNMPGAEKIWAEMIRSLITVCERFYLVADEDDHSTLSALGSLFGTLSSCDMPRLSLATISIGAFPGIPGLRYSLEVPLFHTTAPRLETLAIGGIKVCQPYWSLCSGCHLTSIEFYTGSYSRDVVRLLDAHALTLQRLVLSHVLIDGGDLPMASLPALSTLDLASESTALFTRFRNTSTPCLTTIRVEFNGALAARHLQAFFRQRPDAPVLSLVLCRMQSDFSHYIPVILHAVLRSLVLQGRVEPTFFRNLSESIGDYAFLAVLDTLRISYDDHLDAIGDTLAMFLISLGRQVGGPPRVLAFEPGGCDAPRVPFHFKTLAHLSGLVEECTVGGALSDDILGEVSCWVSARSAKMLSGACFVMLASFGICFTPLQPRPAYLYHLLVTVIFAIAVMWNLRKSPRDAIGDAVRAGVDIFQMLDHTFRRAFLSGGKGETM